MHLDMDATYKVAGWPGIAFYIHGYPEVWEPYTALIEGDDGEEHEEDTGDGEWAEQDETCGRVLVVMLGDDTKREVDVSDLTKLDEDGYCSGCGQIGCGWSAH